MALRVTAAMSGHYAERIALGRRVGDQFSLPRIPRAPGLFSTITGFPKRSWIASARTRPTMSAPPPGANETMMWIGCCGQSCAAIDIGNAFGFVASLAKKCVPLVEPNGPEEQLCRPHRVDRLDPQAYSGAVLRSGVTRSADPGGRPSDMHGQRDREVTSARSARARFSIRIVRCGRRLRMPSPNCPRSPPKRDCQRAPIIRRRKRSRNAIHLTVYLY
jgi:hypothetical protein